ncbi:hypothetical protein [Phascolarctobacterium succinatutens]|jgi:hypothetical protein|uniref:hypothetical protein n=1 Tax=Phascolarctobacterium succinatutens TaxID=626940 RepID=UPI00307BF821
MAYIGYWIGSVVGSSIVLFITMLIFMKIVKIIVTRKGIGVQINVLKHALILAIILGILGNTIFSPGLMGQLSIVMIILAIFALFL